MPATDIPALLEERAAAVEAMRAIDSAATSEGRELSGEEKQEWERREADIQRIEDQIKRDERLASLSEADRRTAEAADRETSGEDGERRTARPTDSSEYRSAFDAYLRGEEHERRDLSVGTNSAGGFTVPTNMADELVVYAREFGAMRRISRVIETDTGATIQVPKITGFAAAAWTDEGAAFNESDPTFAQDTLDAHKMTHIVQVSEELLQDSAFDIEGEIARQAGEALGVLENTAFVVGDGSSKPTGISVTSTEGTQGASGQTTTISADDVYDLIYSVIPAHRRNGRFLTEDPTIAAIRKLKDGNDNYLWQPSMQAGEPSTLAGYPVETDPDVATMAADAKSVLFGNFQRYWIRDAGGISVQRLNERYAELGLVGFRVYRRVDGKLLEPAAVKHYANASS
jgi:HK97 family phage major capsid protein